MPAGTWIPGCPATGSPCGPVPLGLAGLLPGGRSLAAPSAARAAGWLSWWCRAGWGMGRMGNPRWSRVLLGSARQSAAGRPAQRVSTAVNHAKRQLGYSVLPLCGSQGVCRCPQLRSVRMSRRFPNQRVPAHAPKCRHLQSGPAPGVAHPSTRFLPHREKRCYVTGTEPKTPLDSNRARRPMLRACLTVRRAGTSSGSCRAARPQPAGRPGGLKLGRARSSLTWRVASCLAEVGGSDSGPQCMTRMRPWRRELGWGRRR